MKREHLLVLLALAAIIFVTTNSFMYSPPGLCDAPLLGAAHSGAPGEVNCTGCHSGTVNAGPGQLTFDMGVPGNQYTPGQTYTATVSIAQATIDKFGFQVTVLKDSDDTRSGLPVITDVPRTRFIPDATRDYVGNTPCGADASPAGTISWSFDWDAPATNEGDLTAYLSALSTDHSHSTIGDATYTQTIALTPFVVGVKAAQHSKNNFAIHPNPTAGIFTVTGAKGTVQVLDLFGRQVLVTTDREIDLSSLPRGIYHVKVGNAVRKLTLK